MRTSEKPASGIAPEGPVGERMPVSAVEGMNPGWRRPLAGANEAAGAAAVGGMLGEAGTKQAGKAIDENRELGAGDVGEAIYEGSGAKGMHDTAKNISTEEQLAVERGEQGQATAIGRTGIRIGDQIARGMINDPVDKAIKDEEAAAAREKRDPNYWNSGYNAGTDIGGNLTGIKPIANAVAEIDTWEARGAAASQKAAMEQFIASKSRQHTTHIDNLNRQISDLAMSDNAKDPATVAKIQAKVKEMEAEYDYLEKLDQMAGRNFPSRPAGSTEAPASAAVDEARRRFGSIPKPETMKGFVEEMVPGATTQAQASSVPSLDDMIKKAKDEMGNLIPKDTKEEIKTRTGVAVGDTVEIDDQGRVAQEPDQGTGSDAQRSQRQRR